MTAPTMYFPLDELADVGSLPFGDVLDEVLEHIWIANPGFDSTTGEGSIEVLIDKAVEVPVPGISALTLALGDQPGGVNATLQARFTPSVSFTIELPLTLRVASDVLRPMKPGSDEVEPDTPLNITLGSVRVGYDGEGGFILDLPGGLTFPRCMIASSGVVLSATDVRWLTPSSPNLPATVPAGFNGLHLDGASVELIGLPIDPGKIEMKNVYLGTGGFSGAVSWTDTHLSWDGTKFDGVLAGELFGFAGALSRIELDFRQSALTGCDIRGDVFMPYLERRIGLDLALDGRGGFTVAAGLPSSSPAETGVGPGKEGALLHVERDVLTFDLDEVRFAGGVGSPASVSVTGRVKLDIEAIRSPSFTFKKLSIDTNGHVAIDGGWLDIEKAKAADIHGFALEINRIGFGSEPDGRMWFGLNGGVKLAQGLPVGASVEGLKVSWDPKAADVLGSIGVSLEGIGLTLEVKNAFSFKGSVALFSGDPVFGNGFTGHIQLAITPVKVAIEAQLMVGRTKEGLDYVFVYLGVDLPTGIPLFSTGASIYGFAGLVAVNMRPDRRGDESWWNGWYKRDPRGVLEPRRKWTVQKGAFAIGLGTTIGTGMDDGFTINFKVLLILSLPGPIIFLQGKGNFITQRSDSQKPNSVGIFETLVVLDVPGKLFSVNLAATYEKEKLITIGGEAEAAFSWARQPPPDIWHVYAGEKEPPEKRIRGLLIELLKVDTYFQLRQTGIALGARIGFDGDWSFGPARAWAHAYMAMDAAVSWKPPQVDASLQLHGDAGIEAFGAKVLAVLDAVVKLSGPTPWYLGFTLHFELKIDLWFIHFSVVADLPLEWGDKSLPLPAAASPIVATIGAVHPKVAEDVGVLAGATIPPDGRPTVTFARPMLDRGLVGTPNTGSVPADVVGPRQFTYELGHVALAGPRGLVGAAGVLEVSGGAVQLPVELTLPDVSGSTLDLMPGPVSLPVTARTATGLSVTGSVTDGSYRYRLRPASATATVQVTAVGAKPLGIAELTLAADPGAPGVFAGGTLTLGGSTWHVLDVTGTTAVVNVPAGTPTIGTGVLTGPATPALQGAWLPNADRDDPADPGPTTTLMLWARTPYAYFRGSDSETYDGFDAHNPSYACGPEPVEDPICLGFDDLPRGVLTGAFMTDRVPGTATGDVVVESSTMDDLYLEVGRKAGKPAFGTVELRFDPPVDKVWVTCWTGEGGRITLLREDAVIAILPVPRKEDRIAFTANADTVRIEGTLVTVEKVCFTPGWTCIPFDEGSFPQGSTGTVSYAGLGLSSRAVLRVTGDELWADPVSFRWPIGGIIPQQPITMAVIAVTLPQPVTRLPVPRHRRLRSVVVGTESRSPRCRRSRVSFIAVTARTGVIDKFAVSSPNRVGSTGRASTRDRSAGSGRSSGRGRRACGPASRL